MPKTDQIELLSVLRAQSAPVKILGDPILKITPQQAVHVLRTGRYEWGGSTNRVRWMRSIATVAVWRPCWRTTEAACFYPSADYLASL